MTTTIDFIKAALLLHNEESTGLLEDMASRHPCPRTRAMIFSSLIELNLAKISEYKHLILNDPDRYVRERFITHS